MRNSWSNTFNIHSLAFLAIIASSLLAFVGAADENNEQKRMLSYVGFDDFAPYDNVYALSDSADDRPKRDDSARPGLLRFGKRDSDIPGLLRFGKRSETMSKKEMPGVLRFGKRSDMPGVLRFGKRDMDMPGVLRFGKRDSEIPGLLRFGRK